MQKLLVLFALGFLVAIFVAWRRGGVAPGTIPRFWVKSARWLLVEAEGLVVACAQWEEILNALNPGADSRVHALLLELRGSHLFAPRAGLGVIEEGCRIALQADEDADAITALNAAKRSMGIGAVPHMSRPAARRVVPMARPPGQ